jgi:peptidoglycan hydrolase CwlO-like protein
MSYTWERAEQDYQAEIANLQEEILEAEEEGMSSAQIKKELKKWEKDLENIKNRIGDPEDYNY